MHHLPTPSLAPYWLKEPWLVGLLCFQALLFVAALFLRRRPWVQGGIFFLCSEPAPAPSEPAQAPRAPRLAAAATAAAGTRRRRSAHAASRP